MDPSLQAMEVKLLWLPPHFENRRVAKAFEAYGTVQTIALEKWECPGIENIKPLSIIVTLTLREGLVLDKLPDSLNVYGWQTLLLNPGTPPFA